MFLITIIYVALPLYGTLKLLYTYIILITQTLHNYYTRTI